LVGTIIRLLYRMTIVVIPSCSITTACIQRVGRTWSETDSVEAAKLAHGLNSMFACVLTHSDDREFWAITKWCQNHYRKVALLLMWFVLAPSLLLASKEPDEQSPFYSLNCCDRSSTGIELKPCASSAASALSIRLHVRPTLWMQAVVMEQEGITAIVLQLFCSDFDTT
jgi:hypothetical protein